MHGDINIFISLYTERMDFFTFRPLTSRDKIGCFKILRFKKLLATFRKNFRYKFGSISEEADGKPQNVNALIPRKKTASENFSAQHFRIVNCSMDNPHMSVNSKDYPSSMTGRTIQR